jgi:hypothetical protein
MQKMERFGECCFSLRNHFSLWMIPAFPRVIKRSGYADTYEEVDAVLNCLTGPTSDYRRFSLFHLRACLDGLRLVQ